MSFLAWLLSFFSRRPGSERAIFSYFDGEKQRGTDPLVAWRAIWAHPEIDLQTEVKRSTNIVIAGKPVYEPQEVYEAEDRIRQLTREVFGVKAWNENTPGLTVEETDRLLSDFFGYMDGLKKKRKTLPTTSQVSELKPPPNSMDTSEADSPTTSPSDSGSTERESTAVGPSGS